MGHGEWPAANADLAALAQSLTPATHIGGRLLTLSGVAGSGKTRLALAVADTVRDLYEDGVWLVELAPLPANPSSGPAAVAAAVSNALGLHEQPGRALTDTLAAGLHAQRLLLILDNCEHVVGASAAFAARLLGACPGLRILATSQVPLGVADEIVWRVGMLAAPAAVPTRPALVDLRRLERSEAIQLFVQRARAVQPGFLLSAENAAVVVTRATLF